MPPSTLPPFASSSLSPGVIGETARHGPLLRRAPWRPHTGTAENDEEASGSPRWRGAGANAEADDASPSRTAATATPRRGDRRHDWPFSARPVAIVGSACGRAMAAHFPSESGRPIEGSLLAVFARALALAVRGAGGGRVLILSFLPSCLNIRPIRALSLLLFVLGEIQRFLVSPCSWQRCREQTASHNTQTLACFSHQFD